ncbi:hypothetical protein M0811_07351 [Anaeramoeba ignava]|uniref:Uncharacterized protein n=1 Tax=Anaeramoeba ignava TaxID=1746090 RepID=A0A9Q0LKY1_ANAIG|nr:hypothetical protein M0811_07351 [Anaeramoeba ignava]
MIYKEMKKAKKGFIRYQKQQNLNYNYSHYQYDSKKYLLNEVILGMNGIILISTLIILNIYIDSKKSISIPKLFLLSELDLIITIFWIIYSKFTFYSFQDYHNYLDIAITGFIFMILISLKTLFNFIPWLIILIPPIILFISLIPQIMEQMKRYSDDKPIFSSFISGLIYLIIILFFIGLKLDGFIQIKYSKLIYLLIIFEIYILYSKKNEFQNQDDFIGSLILFVSVSIIILILFLYGDGIIKKLWISLIPIYIILTLIFFFFLLLFSFSFI